MKYICIFQILIFSKNFALKFAFFKKIEFEIFEKWKFPVSSWNLWFVCSTTKNRLHTDVINVVRRQKYVYTHVQTFIFFTELFQILKYEWDLKIWILVISIHMPFFALCYLFSHNAILCGRCWISLWLLIFFWQKWSFSAINFFRKSTLCKTLKPVIR